MSGHTHNRDETIARSDRLWAELSAACDSSPRNTLHIEGDRAWTGRDIYGHFVGMHRATLAMLEHALETGEVEWPGARPGETEDEHNERRRVENAAETFDALRREANKSRDQLRALLLSLDDAQWSRWGHRRYIDDFEGGHYAGHLAYIAGEEPDPWP